MVIDGEYDLELAARRILWGKMINAGQVCISPDYVLVPRDKQDALVSGFEKAYALYSSLLSAKSLSLSDGNNFSQTALFRPQTLGVSLTKGTIVESRIC